MIPLFSQKHTKEDMLAFFLIEKNEIMLLANENQSGYEPLNLKNFSFLNSDNFNATGLRF